MAFNLLCEVFTDKTEKKKTNKPFCCHDFPKMLEKEQVNKIEKQNMYHLSIHLSI